MVPPSPSRLTPPTPKAEPSPTELTERCVWTSRLCKWVRAPPIRLGATPMQLAAYLEQWKQRALADECADNEQLMQMEHEEPHEEEDERRARACRSPTGSAAGAVGQHGPGLGDAVPLGWPCAGAGRPHRPRLGRQGHLGQRARLR